MRLQFVYLFCAGRPDMDEQKKLVRRVYVGLGMVPSGIVVSLTGPLCVA